MGRPTKLTPALQQAIVQAVTGGVPYVQACLMADVSDATALMWRQRGRGELPDRPATPLYVEFVDAVKKAEAQDEARRLLRINQAGQGGVIIHEKTVTSVDGTITREVKRTNPEWTADAWHLERKYPDRYGRRVIADVNVQIRQIASQVAEELGVDVEVLLAEATQLLTEGRHADRA